MSRIIWTQEQNNTVAKNAMVIYNITSMSFMESLLLAQKVLPKELQRSAKAMVGGTALKMRKLGEKIIAQERAAASSVPFGVSQKYMDKLADTMHAMEAKSTKLEAELNGRMEKLVALEQRVESSMRKMSEMTATIDNMLKQVDDSSVSLELMRGELATQLHAVQGMLTDVTKTQAGTKPIEGVTVKVTKKKENLQRVMVIGLRNDQVEMLKHEYADRFRFTFIDTESVVRNLTSRASKMDHVITTRFIDHAQFYPVRDLPSHVHVTGGMTSLRKQLDSF